MIEVQNNSVPLGLPNQVFVTESPSPKSYIILHVHRQLTKIPKIQSNIDAHQKPSMKSSKHYNNYIIISTICFSPPNPQGHLKKHSQPTASLAATSVSPQNQAAGFVSAGSVPRRGLPMAGDVDQLRS